MKIGAYLSWLRPLAPAIAIAGIALVLALTFAWATIRHNGRFGLPIEDSYIYLTYAKQFGRGEPFTYFSGGGYSAGSTSVLWPMLIAPFWTLGARGHALVWVSFGLCTVLYMATSVACYRLARTIAGQATGILAAAITLATAPFAFTSLAGMEVAFASTLLLVSLILLASAPRTGPPTRLFTATLAGLSLSRPEAALLVALVVGVTAIQRLRNRERRAAVRWLAPLVPLVLWLAANRAFAGNWFPNTGVAKSHFYQPGFDWMGWLSHVKIITKDAFAHLCTDPSSPFMWPKLFSLLWIIGAGRIVLWARREGRWLAGILIVIAPIVLVLAVIGTTGQWGFHRYRYIAPAFPLFAIIVACAFAPVPLPERVRAPWPIWIDRGRVAVIALFGLGYGYTALPRLRAERDTYAQTAVDLEHQVIKIGNYVHDKLPGSTVMLHDAGAIAYYGDGPVIDMLGLVTNRQAQVANNGPGSRFEYLERLPPDRRPTHFAYYEAWMGQEEFYGETLLDTALGAQFSSGERLIGADNMQVIAASWDHVHTAERPLDPHPGWHVVDRVDVADIDDEKAHHWRSAMGSRWYSDRGAKWSVFHREVSAKRGLLLDGGRTIRGRHELFEIAIDPTRKAKLVMRIGGNREYEMNEVLVAAPKITVTTTTGSVVTKGPGPNGTLVEIEFDLPPGNDANVAIDVTSNQTYRVFHWFVLQPD